MCTDTDTRTEQRRENRKHRSIEKREQKQRASRSLLRQVYGTLHFTCVLPMLSYLEGSRSELNFKIISRWFQTSQNAAQNGAKTSPLDDFLAHLGAKMAPRCATWRVFGSILVTFVESWARSLRKVTDCKTLVKHNEKAGFCGAANALGGYLGSSWR